MSQNTDSGFFTNAEGNTVLDRFKRTLRNAQYFDVLVGYFRTSGFSLLAESLKDVEKIRIIVGLNTDASIVNATFFINQDVRNDYSSTLQREIENAPENKETENSIKLFMKYLAEGKIEIKGFPSRDIHAKVYIIRYKEGALLYGSVITGSSNFTSRGLEKQQEFNVELTHGLDVKFALDYFERLWNQSVVLNQDFIARAAKKTWLNDSISPYELYLKFLYEYFKEDIVIDTSQSFMMPKGFSEFNYQKQAVTAAKRILALHNGVFLADVVGLGKTFISAMLLQQLPGHKIIICPPALKEYWEESLRSFDVHPFSVFSLGILNQLDARKFSDSKYVLVDESHKFKNESTQRYKFLKDICIGKKVILLSATPYNNNLTDLLAQVKLFQFGAQSTIPGVENLQGFFNNKQRALHELDPKKTDYKEKADKIVAEVREKVLKYVMIRRTRSEIKKYFQNDMKKQGLTFPIVEKPIPFYYEFDDALDKNFQKTLDLLEQFGYTLYTPLLYLKKGLNAQQRHTQNNLPGLIKCLLVKRFESSFYAFAKTVKRFLDRHQTAIEYFHKGFVYIGENIDIDTFRDHEEDGDLEKFLEEKGTLYPKEDFSENFFTMLQHDYETLQSIFLLWEKNEKDPKYDIFLYNLENHDFLKNERMLVFTESKDTAEYLYSKIEKKHPQLSMMFSSQEGKYQNKIYSPHNARRLIQQNFDPSQEAHEDFRILITTDVLSEGMNLHRAGRIINYDLPWNPTRIIQRLGRINRIGTVHKNLYVFNFLPTTQANAEIEIEEKVTKKINAFNAVLGNDNKLLYDVETPDPHGLFKKLSGKSAILEEESEDSELKYLSLIRKIHDNNPKLFEKVKSLPLKARSAQEVSYGEKTDFSDSLIIFFRQGELKKFLCVDKQEGVKELTFLDTAKLMQCAPNTERKKFPADDYYERLQKAKDFLTHQEETTILRPPQDNTKKQVFSNIRYLQDNTTNDDDREYLGLLYVVVEKLGIGKQDIKKLSKVDMISDPLAHMKQIVSLETLRDLERNLSKEHTSLQPKQILLAQYLAPKGEL